VTSRKGVLLRRRGPRIHPAGTPDVDQGNLATILMAAAPDTVTVLDPGHYTISGLDIDDMQQAATAGQYAGYRIIMAPYPGAVTVDPTGWELNDGVQSLHDIRMVFAGLDFENGTQIWEWCQYFWFYYCRYTNPILNWLGQYAAVAGSTPPFMSKLSASVCNALGTNFTASSHRIGSCTNNGWVGCDARHIGDDWVFANNSGTASYVIGLKEWDVYHHNHQFIHPDNDASTYMHSDGYQVRSDGGVHLSDSWMGAHGQFVGEVGDTVEHLARVWFAGSPFSAASIGDGDESHPSKVVGGEMTDCVYFANAQFIDPDFESGHSFISYDYPFTTTPFNPTDTGWQGIGDEITNGSSTFVIDADFGLNGAGSLPSGVTVNAHGILTDIANAADPTVAYDLPQIANHPDNPANLWRATTGHAYGDLLTYFSDAGDSPVTLWAA
jgi:hypothetical protein